MNGNTGRPIPNVAVTEVDDRFFLLHPDGARVMVLNESAYAVWEVWDRVTDFESLVHGVAALFGKAAEDIRPDVQAALQDFSTHGFLQD